LINFLKKLWTAENRKLGLVLKPPVKKSMFEDAPNEERALVAAKVMFINIQNAGKTDKW